MTPLHQQGTGAGAAVVLLDQLATLYKPEGVLVFLRGRNGLLNDERPIDLIAAGRIEEVERVVTAMTDGVFL